MIRQFHRNCLFLWLVLFTLAVHSQVEAEVTPSYGMEVELRSPLNFLTPAAVLVPLNYLNSTLGRPVKRVGPMDYMAGAMRTRYIKLMTIQCAKTKLCKVEGDKVTYPERGFSFRITQDPSVVEVVLSPMTLDQLKANRDILNDHLFVLPSRIGLAPALNILSGGHVHIGIKEAFQSDPLKFINFVTDFVNHPALSSGALLWDPFEAPPLLPTQAERDQFKKILEDFDAGKLKTVEEIQSRLVELGFAKVSMTPKKGALNVKTAHGTIEIRSNRSFQSADHLIDTINLFENRIQLLDKYDGRIAYLDVGPPQSIEESVAQFHNYATSAGGEWNRFRKLLPSHWRKVKFDPASAYRSKEESLPFLYRCRHLFSILD